MHAQFVTVAFVADGNGIVQILGILPVNGDGLKMAKIQSAIPVSIQNMIWYT